MIKIIEGIAEDIENVAEDLGPKGYVLDSLQFTFRKYIYTKSGDISEDEHNFYAAVFKKQVMISNEI